MRKTNVDCISNKGKAWTADEDMKVVTKIKENPQNLSACFIALSAELHRSKGAIVTRWYNVISKDPDVLCFFTASSKHISKNRKNGVGEPNTVTIWRKLTLIINNFLNRKKK